MIRQFKQFLYSVFRRLWRRDNRRVKVPERPIQNPEANAGMGNVHRIPRTGDRNPAIEALQDIFAPRHKAEEHVVFTAVSHNGALVEKSEEWLRDGHSMKTILKRSAVVTCSGEVVSAGNIKSKCATCGGFDSHIARCSHPQCGVALCRLHQRLFTYGSTPTMLCENHFRAAIQSFNTWAALDRAEAQGRQ